MPLSYEVSECEKIRKNLIFKINEKLTKWRVDIVKNALRKEIKN